MSPIQSKALTDPFWRAVSNTRITGQIPLACPISSRRIEEGKKDFGMFQGFEYAWIQENFPKLKPLMIAAIASAI